MFPAYPARGGTGLAQLYPIRNFWQPGIMGGKEKRAVAAYALFPKGFPQKLPQAFFYPGNGFQRRATNRLV